MKEIVKNFFKLPILVCLVALALSGWLMLCLGLTTIYCGLEDSSAKFLAIGTLLVLFGPSVVYLGNTLLDKFSESYEK